MKGVFMQVVPFAAMASGGIAGLFAAFDLSRVVQLRKRKRNALAHQKAVILAAASGVNEIDFGENSKKDLPSRLIAYAQGLSKGLLYHSIAAISPTVRSAKAHDTHAASFLLEHAAKAGYPHLDANGFIEARFRLTLVGAAAGMLLGAPLSTEMMIVLGVIGAVFGWRSLRKCLLSIERHRGVEAESSVSEMLEVVALGLRSGLTFDRSFAMYGDHFESAFAQSCASACKSWSLGLATREEALRNLSASYACETLDKAVEGAIRSLRFGASFADDLEEMAAQSREKYRAVVSEKVAKAPVKMMLPTGALILPAMLLLVLGPILLELAQGF